MKAILSRYRSALVLILAALPAFSTRAIIVTNVTIDSVSSELEAFDRFSTNVVDGSGLFGDAHTGVANGAMWLTHGNFATPFDPANQAQITFDLGTVRTLDQMRVWNYNEFPPNLSARGIATANILVAGEDRVFTNLISGQAFTRAPGALTNFSQTISLGGVSARFVKINVLTNHGDNASFAGLSEVQFIDTNLPPTLISAARKFSNRQVAVRFSEPVSPATATNAGNYSINSGVTVSNAVMGGTANVVILNTSVLQSNGVYTVAVNGVRDFLGAQPVPSNSQVAIGTELALWLRSDAGITLDPNGQVSEWADQSGNSNTVTEATDSFRPLFVTNVFNGQPVLRFDGVDDDLSSPDSPTLKLTGDMTVYAVVQLADYQNYNAIVAKTAGNLPAPFDLYTSPSSGFPQFFRGNGGSAFAAMGGTKGLSTNAPQILSVNVSGPGAVQYLNGAVNGTGILSAPTKDLGNPLWIGTREDSVTRLAGDLAEVMIFNAALSDADRVALDTYLGNKYGIAVISLVITEQPASTNRLEGQTATFRVVATANSPNVTYQWQRNNGNIPGATNAVYTTPVLTLADSNSTYRVVVSIPGTSQTSQSALLTVFPDRAPPTILSAGKSIFNPSQVTIVFSEPVSSATATNKSLYVFDNGVTVSNAQMGANPDTVILVTSPIPEGTPVTLTVNGVQDLFGNSIAANSLVAIGLYPPGLALWLSADQGVTADAGGSVSQWNDRSGNGNHATQSVPDSMPLLIAGALNGKPVVRFDGADDSLSSPDSPSLEITGDLTIFAVASFVDYGNYNGIVSKTAGNLPASFDLYTVAGSGQPRLYRGDGGAANAQVSGTAAPSTGVPHLLSVVMRGTDVAHYLDGESNGTGTLVTALADGGTAVGIGTRSDGVTLMKGDFAEVLLFGSAINDSDRRAIDAYLGNKYGITVESVALSASVSGNQFTISWPVTIGSYVLESTTVLPATNWTLVTAPVQQANGRNTVTIPATGTAQFFRLRKT